MNEIRNRMGQVVATGTFGIKSFAATWADDNLHYCFIQPFNYIGANGVPATLELGSPGATPRRVAVVGQVFEQVSTYVASCSVLTDRAVVVQSGGQGIGIAQYWMVQLSTGKLLWTHDFSSSLAPITVVVSPDSGYVAESFDTATAAQNSTIYDAQGSKVTHLNASVAAFSWDDSTVVLSSRQAPHPVSVVNVIRGDVLWTAPAGAETYIWNVRAEPGTGRLAIGIARSDTPPGARSPSGLPPVDLYLLAPSGRLVTTLRAVYW